MKVKFFDPGKSYMRMKVEINAEIKRVLSAGDLILRADVEKFEDTLAKYVGTKYAVALNSGTDALYLSLMALGIGPGDSVLVPAHTFVATAQVVHQLGATPILYDMEIAPIDLGGIKAIVVAHIAGDFDPRFDQMRLAAGGASIPLIEDACQALGATKDDRKAGSFGITGCFSFYPAKLLGAFGDAGALVTNDKSLAEEVRELRNHYKKDYSKWGINSRMDNLQAAILNVKFTYHRMNLLERSLVAEKYRGLGDYVRLPKYSPERVWQDFVIHVDNRDALYDFLKKKGIETMKNEYPFPIQKPPKALEYESRTLRIPCNENLTKKEVQYVIDSIIEFYERKVQ